MYLTPTKLKSLISYNDNAAEVKVIKEDGDKKVMLIALLEGQILPKHTTPLEALLYVIKGDLSFKTDEKTVRIREKEILRIPPNVEHEVFANEKSKFIVIRF